jgi:hypothetical protein
LTPLLSHPWNAASVAAETGSPTLEHTRKRRSSESRNGRHAARARSADCEFTQRSTKSSVPRESRMRSSDAAKGSCRAGIGATAPQQGASDDVGGRTVPTVAAGGTTASGAAAASGAGAPPPPPPPPPPLVVETYGPLENQPAEAAGWPSGRNQPLLAGSQEPRNQRCRLGLRNQRRRLGLTADPAPDGQVLGPSDAG